MPSAPARLKQTSASVMTASLSSRPLYSDSSFGVLHSSVWPRCALFHGLTMLIAEVVDDAAIELASSLSSEPSVAPAGDAVPTGALPATPRPAVVSPGSGEVLQSIRKQLQGRNEHLLLILDEVDHLLRADKGDLLYQLLRIDESQSISKAYPGTFN